MAQIESVLVLQKQLAKAEQDIEALREVVDWTVQIIVAAGGRVEVTPETAAQLSQMKWRREADRNTGAMVFTAWIDPATLKETSHDKG